MGQCRINSELAGCDIVNAVVGWNVPNKEVVDRRANPATLARVGVVGGGPVGQAHLRRLLRLDDLFEVCGLVDRSDEVRERLAERHRVPVACAEHTELLGAAGLDALLICTPSATHAQIAIDALRAGLHVFVEPPLCITLADADRIIALRDETGLVVQVGYANRFDAAYAQMCSSLPEHADELRYVEVSSHLPGRPQLLAARSTTRSDPLHALQQDAWRQEAKQALAAVGARTRRETVMFCQVYLGALSHEINLVQGLLERMHESLPSSVDHSAWWEGPAVTAALRLGGGAHWGLTSIDRAGPRSLRDRISLYFEDAVHSLFPSAVHAGDAETVYEHHCGGAELHASRLVSLPERRFLDQLRHFHDCVIAGARCRTPPEQARADIELLSMLFRAARDASNEGRVAQLAAGAA